MIGTRIECISSIILVYFFEKYFSVNVQVRFTTELSYKSSIVNTLFNVCSLPICSLISSHFQTLISVLKYQVLFSNVIQPKFYCNNQIPSRNNPFNEWVQIDESIFIQNIHSKNTSAKDSRWSKRKKLKSNLFLGNFFAIQQQKSSWNYAIEFNCHWTPKKL